jgi:hypothetical protein
MKQFKELFENKIIWMLSLIIGSYSVLGGGIYFIIASKEYFFPKQMGGIFLIFGVIQWLFFLISRFSNNRSEIRKIKDDASKELRKKIDMLRNELNLATEVTLLALLTLIEKEREGTSCYQRVFSITSLPSYNVHLAQFISKKLVIIRVNSYSGNCSANIDNDLYDLVKLEKQKLEALLNIN